MASVVKSFWKNKKVFLTGHTGFKGSWLSIWLNSMGAEVTGYSLVPPSTPSLFEEAQVANLVKSQINDVGNYPSLLAALQKSEAEIVIHMAAQALVRYSYENPLETYQTNVMGTANLLQACRFVNSIKAIVNVTSDKCYENQERPGPGYREDEPMGGYDPYSSSKGCAELVTSAFRRSFYLNEDKSLTKGIASARAGNVIGGGDWAEDRLLPDVFRALTAKKEILIRNPRAIRPWQHVLEPLSGYLILAQNLFENPSKFSEGFNFGPQESDAKEVEYIVENLVKKWGDGASYKVHENKTNPHEAHFLKLDCTKSQKILQWKPQWNLDQALEKTISWNKKYFSKSQTALGLVQEQIEEYQG
jgi:CDP-glucose 4,6-dehydratase